MDNTSIKHMDSSLTGPIEEFLSRWPGLLKEHLVSKKKDEASELGAVIYTDGGCRPARGIGGWGIHGYLYLREEPKQGHGCRDIPTPHGYEEKDKNLSTKVTVLKYIDGSGSLIPESTNNEAELEALYHALFVVDRCEVKTVQLLLDSEYALKGATERLERWASLGWNRPDGNPLANLKQWMKIREMLHKLRDKGVMIKWNWVKGHNDNLGNVMADANATRGIIAGRKDIKVVDLRLSDTLKYWKPEVDRHPFLNEPRWYFKTNVPKETYTTATGQYVYHLGKHDEDEHFGKKVADTYYAVVHLDKPDLTLEMIRQHQEELSPLDYNNVVIARLDNLFNPRVFSELDNNETLYLQRMGPNIDIFTFDETPLTIEMKPVRLAFRAIEELSMLETVLTSFKTGHLANSQLTEITDILYESIDSKKKIKRKLTLQQETSAVKVDVNYDVGSGPKTTSITLTVGVDLPKRNLLSSLSDTTAKVYVVTWKESLIAFRYGVIVSMENECGIWAAVYSNLHLVNKDT